MEYQSWFWFGHHFWIWLLISAVICGIITEEIGGAKRRPIAGSFAWGFFLGILGILIVALLPRGEDPAPPGMVAVKCPRCNAKQNIRPRAASFECWQCKTTVPVVIV